ncbi:bifunctional adenosylcobinamide kinase/adenosylcobinamide-phosphate guanylyltransferase [Peristeroidobacter soli]|jgi:adenosylcobinamide kinase/adenosylcobinamide-phosphate guanylyltransferase|uniref:bifunctional adenosylcobinamide kinase/adenosylcobinamide-phosphate guanylyltransferase n=1 Tax=Peristeroidobacter soli TaxID=2497877 RepID=UPI00101C3D52|nr:bifunctional adenosylcobinamide kinase/adenosylcobinamide-phosphate guanylyltransferase [Peristeroidobacter soli]
MVENDGSGERASVGRRLIIGGARSGKTAHAIALAKSLSAARGMNVTYVATAQALDQEMQHRISLHRAERPATWRTLEAPTGLAQALAGQEASSIVVVDCMTLWLSNALLQDFREDAPTAPLPAWQAERDKFLQWLSLARVEVLLISNEVGMGIVPLAPVARRFQDEQGRLNQMLAAACDQVTLVVAGIAVPIKRFRAG